MPSERYGDAVHACIEATDGAEHASNPYPANVVACVDTAADEPLTPKAPSAASTTRTATRLMRTSVPNVREEKVWASAGGGARNVGGEPLRDAGLGDRAVDLALRAAQVVRAGAATPDGRASHRRR